MSIIASALKHMLAAGMPHDAIVAAVEEMEASAQPAKPARVARNAKYYEAHKEELRLKASERRLNATERLNPDDPPSPLSPDKEIPPAPPKEINPNPPLPPISVGSAPAKHRKPTNGAIAYHPDFELLWREFPFQSNASKKDGYTAWLRLPEEDRDKCLDGAMSYAEWLEGERRKRPEYPGKHLSTFINGRSFDTLLEIRA